MEATFPAGVDYVYLLKTRDELEPFLALSPNVFGLETETGVAPRFLIADRPIPFYVLGIV